MGMSPLICWACRFESRRDNRRVSCYCRVLADRGLWVGLITRPEESYRAGCVQGLWAKPRTWRPWATIGSKRQRKKKLYSLMMAWQKRPKHVAVGFIVKYNLHLTDICIGLTCVLEENVTNWWFLKERSWGKYLVLQEQLMANGGLKLIKK